MLNSIPELVILSFVLLVSSVQASSQKYEQILMAGDTEKSIVTKIVGGNNAFFNSYPWFALGQNGFCGGSLISSDWVLSAAHCIDKISAVGFRIGALCHSNGNCGQESEYIQIIPESTVVHPNYMEGSKFDNDFVLFRLDGPSKIEPVNIDVGDSLVSGQKLTAIGFGSTGECTPGDCFKPNRLQHVDVPYIPNTSCCSDSYWYSCSSITENMICAGKKGKDSCIGDSGGPLYDKANNVLVGITSWGIGCGRDNYPGVYSRVSAQADWIKSVVCPGHSPSSRPSWCPAPTTAPTPTPEPTPTSEPTPTPTPEPPQEPICKETKWTKFYHYTTKSGKQKFKNCNWLSRRGAAKVKKICNKTTPMTRTLAREACPITCGC
uniref:Peptidase S1 domain-containing protein n=1 Tax=Chaetoceros debilis TaxID=122233 RepID=A0A7S3Q6F6_9STRA